MEKVANVDLKFLRNDAEYFCIQGLVKIVDEEIEKTEKGEALRLEQISSVVSSQDGIERAAWQGGTYLDIQFPAPLQDIQF